MKHIENESRPIYKNLIDKESDWLFLLNSLNLTWYRLF